MARFRSNSPVSRSFVLHTVCRATYCIYCPHCMWRVQLCQHQLPWQHRVWFGSTRNLLLRGLCFNESGTIALPRHFTVAWANFLLCNCKSSFKVYGSQAIQLSPLYVLEDNRNNCPPQVYVKPLGQKITSTSSSPYRVLQRSASATFLPLCNVF